MSAPIKYLLLQLPGWLLLGALLAWAVGAGLLGTSLALLLFALWLVKDAALYPAFRHALQPAPAAGARALIGREAVVVRALAPDGLVRIGAELWTARPRGEAWIGRGARVRVVEARGLVLRVESSPRR